MKDLINLRQKGRAAKNSKKKLMISRSVKDRISLIIKRIFFMLIVICLMISSAVALFFMLAPEFFKLESDQNIVFINYQDNQIDKMWLIRLYHTENTIVVHKIKNSQDWALADIDQADLVKKLSLEINFFIDNTMEVNSNSLEHLDDIKLVFKNHLLNTGLNKKNLSSELGYYFFVRNSNSQFFYFNQLTDDYLSFTDNDYSKCSLAVLNSTDTSGLAGQFSDIFEKMGFSVIRTTSDQINLEESIISYDPEKKQCASLIDRVQNTFNFKSKFEESINNQYRSNVVLILGNDSAALVKADNN